MTKRQIHEGNTTLPHPQASDQGWSTSSVLYSSFRIERYEKMTSKDKGTREQLQETGSCFGKSFTPGPGPLTVLGKEKAQKIFLDMDT